MKRHAEILAEYRGYRRAGVYQFLGLLITCGLGVWADVHFWPVALVACIASLGAMAFGFWKLRNLKSSREVLQERVGA